MDISVVIVQLTLYFGMNPYDINDGFCGMFAETIEEIIPGAEAVEAHPDSKYFGHTWIEYKERYYDAEVPFGVDKLDNLPFFKRKGDKL